MLITLHHHYNSTTLQLQLQLQCITLHPAVVSEVTTATIATAPKNTTPTTFSIGPSMDLLCHPWLTTTNLSYRFPIFETSAAALCGTTGRQKQSLQVLVFKLTFYIPWLQIRLACLLVVQAKQNNVRLAGRMVFYFEKGFGMCSFGSLDQICASWGKSGRDVMRPSLLKASDGKCAGSVLTANSTLKFLANSGWEHMCVCMYVSIYQSINQPIYVSNLSIYLWLYLSIYLSVYLSIYLSI